jgi:hypothetical protein
MWHALQYADWDSQGHSEPHGEAFDATGAHLRSQVPFCGGLKSARPLHDSMPSHAIYLRRIGVLTLQQPTEKTT